MRKFTNDWWYWQGTTLQSLASKAVAKVAGWYAIRYTPALRVPHNENAKCLVAVNFGEILNFNEGLASRT